MNNISIAITDSSSPYYQQIWQLREDVLRIPIGLSLKNEDLSMDAEDVIFIAKNADEVMGCLMLHRLDATTIKFRQMAVYDAWQGTGIGRLLMEAAEKYAFEQGYSKVSLHARKIVSGFYQRLGYICIGNEFEEVGISHVLMEKLLM